MQMNLTNIRVARERKECSHQVHVKVQAQVGELHLQHLQWRSLHLVT